MRGQVTAKLLLLLAGGVAVTVAGVSATLYVVRPNVSNAAMVDAGVTDAFNPRWLSCWVSGEVCDGGGTCQKRIPAAVAKTSDGGARDAIFASKAQAQRFRDTVRQFGEGMESCRIYAATWPEIAQFDSDPADDVPPCGCRARLDAGTCRQVDGGALALAQTYQAGDWQGACVPTLCGGPAGSEPLSGTCR